MDNFENETGIPCRLYVLKEWHDVLGYGEEEIQVFPSRDLARAKLKKDFCKWAHIDESEWNKAPKMFNIGKDWFTRIMSKSIMMSQDLISSLLMKRR